uniref:Platelet-activating factor receptor n=1 Tax=Myripristis murdjan TaxID=586833 RepID=A0A667Z363_9TELE
MSTEAAVMTPAATNSTFLDSEFRYKLFPAFYSIIFILGFCANCYVLFVLRHLREAKAMGEIRIYMTNLTVADLLFVCALPFWIGYYRRWGDWVYSDVLCRLTGSMFFINTYCSVLFLGAISINRYWAVTQPLNAASSDHRCRGIAVTITIWALTVAMSIPSLISPGINVDEKNVTRCFEGYHREGDGEKRVVAAIHFTIIAVFFIVFILVVVCNLLTALASPRGVKRRALRMLCAVVGVFVLCFLPHHIIQGLWTLAVLEIKEGWGSTDWTLETRQALNDAHQITLLLMGLNCILDPVVYYFATRKFRKFITSHVKKIAKGDACSQTATSQISLDSRREELWF